MDRLAEIIRQVDLMALQEITDSSGQALVSLVERVNQYGARYSYVVSPRMDDNPPAISNSTRLSLIQPESLAERSTATWSTTSRIYYTENHT